MPAPSAWTTPSAQTSTVARCSLRQSLRADAPPRVEAEAEQRGEVAGDDAEAGEDGPVAHRERDGDARDAGVQPGVAEQGDAVDGDRDQAGQRGLLVQAGERWRDAAPRTT